MRCSRCLMPSTVPNSEFNEANECIWCQTGFPWYLPKGTEKLKELLESNRNKSGLIDCLVAISGGKDSSYMLMELKQTFGMRVEAFTYLHDGLTPFALENAKRVCKKLDIEHHTVSLPKGTHAELFRTFFATWIKSQSTTSAAMTCVACKYMHILGTKLAVKRGIPIVTWAVFPLETPPIIPIGIHEGDPFRRPSLIKGASLLFREMTRSFDLTKGIMKNLSTCFQGCLAFDPSSEYLKFRYPSVKQIFFFDYYDWDPNHIIDKLKSKADWEPPKDVADDWHTDCVYHIIKEYMFQKMFNVAYIDGFLSNQVRYGILTRAEALNKLIKCKEELAVKIHKTIDFAGLGEFEKYIDPTCFEIED